MLTFVDEKIRKFRRKAYSIFEAEILEQTKIEIRNDQ